MSGKHGRQPFPYHGVVRGRKIGVFESWVDANESVQGYSNCSHQGFYTLQEAVTHLGTCGVSPIEVHTGDVTRSLKDYQVKLSAQKEQLSHPHRAALQLPTATVVHIAGNPDPPEERDSDATLPKEILKQMQTAKKSQPQDEQTPQEPTIDPHCPICAVAADDKNALTCSTCNFKIHYKCSSLPVYQVSHLVSDRRRKFICENCTDIKDDVKVLMQLQQTVNHHSDLTDKQPHLSADAAVFVPSSAIQKTAKAPQTATIGTDPPTPFDLCQCPDKTATPGTHASDSTQALTSRINQLESTLVNMVQGLCQDIDKARQQQLTEEVKSAKSEYHNAKIQLDVVNRRCRDLEKQIQSQTGQSKCQCSETKRQAEKQQQEAAKQYIEQDIQISELKKELQKCRKMIEDQKSTMNGMSGDLNTTTELLKKTEGANEELTSKMASLDKDLQDAKDAARDLEHQIEAAKDDNPNPWLSDPSDCVKVKGEKNPMSNFYAHPIAAFGQQFDSLEHALQFKKVLDHEMYQEAEEVKSQPTAKLAKDKADQLLGKSETIGWENQCVKTMRFLLDVKKNSCKEFVTALEATGKKIILHNVASPKWGTGGNGKGRNLFGEILMTLRGEMFPHLVQPKQQKPNSAPANKLPKSSPQASTSFAPLQVRPQDKPQPSSNTVRPSKPQVLLVGNSHVDNIYPNKVSRDFNMIVEKAFTIKEARDTIQSLTSNPDAVALHLTINDVKGHEPGTVVKEYQELVSLIQNKLPTSKILISQAPFKLNTSKLSTRAALVNASLQDAYRGKDIMCISNDNIKSFANDSIHLTRYGTSHLVRNLKAGVQRALNMAPSPGRHPSGSQHYNQQSDRQHYNQQSHQQHNQQSDRRRW